VLRLLYPSLKAYQQAHHSKIKPWNGTHGVAIDSVKQSYLSQMRDTRHGVNSLWNIRILIRTMNTRQLLPTPSPYLTSSPNMIITRLLWGFFRLIIRAKPRFGILPLCFFPVRKLQGSVNHTLSNRKRASYPLLLAVSIGPINQLLKVPIPPLHSVSTTCKQSWMRSTYWK
jgi:hypothetical protein